MQIVVEPGGTLTKLVGNSEYSKSDSLRKLIPEADNSAFTRDRAQFIILWSVEKENFCKEIFLPRMKLLQRKPNALLPFP